VRRKGATSRFTSASGGSRPGIERQVTGTSDVANETTPFLVALTGVTAVGPGATHTCAVAGGSIWCWGDHANGQIGSGNTSSGPYGVTTLAAPTNAADVSSGMYHSCAVTSDGGFGNGLFEISPFASAPIGP
jgi:alpha-tubulin suppressor-like RCC1 family protein